MSVKILGIKIHNVNLKQAHDKVRVYLNSNKQHKIFTPNPEMLVDAQKDKYFKDVLNLSDLNICDGKGIELVSRGNLTRIPGVDFMLEICKIAEEEGGSVYLLGSGNNQVVEKTRQKMVAQFPNLRIVGTNSGPQITMKQCNNVTMINVDKQTNDSIIDDIITQAPDILFVAFGHGKQEKWIYEYLKNLPSVKIAMGVGGAFDYISGNIKRAPKWISKIGFEWLWRLVNEPKRIKRILTALIIFPYLCLTKTTSKD